MRGEAEGSWGEEEGPEWRGGGQTYIRSSPAAFEWSISQVFTTLHHDSSLGIEARGAWGQRVEGPDGG